MTFFCARLILALCPPCSCSAPALFLLCPRLILALCPPNSSSLSVLSLFPARLVLFHAVDAYCSHRPITVGYFSRHIIPHHHVKESKQKERERGSGIIGYRHRLYKQRSPRAQKEGQELSDIDTGYTSRGLRGAQKEGQEDSERGSERMGYRHRERG